MRILDLFCCEGGASAGYRAAGFDVVGVDIDAQPRYPFRFVQADALSLLGALVDGALPVITGGRDYWLSDFDAIHASPPCQAYSSTRHQHDTFHPELIEPVRELLVASGLPYVIENVVGAPLLHPLRLCGSEFGLSALCGDGVRRQLRRHRLFESNVFLLGNGGCFHRGEPVGFYGSGGPGAMTRGYKGSTADGRQALGNVSWMSQRGQSQCIPPVYAEHVGTQLVAYIAGARELELV